MNVPWSGCRLRHTVLSSSRSRLPTRPSRRYASTEDNPIIRKAREAQEKRKAQGPQAQAAAGATQGGLAPGSVFAPNSLRSSTGDDAPKTERNPSAVASKLDPNPLARRRWERKMVIQSIQKRGRLTKEQVIKRTERSALAKSEFWKTSMKKLQPLANQIAGKTIEDAIVQMRFSKKKPAAFILKHLEEARDRAIVERGMGLGVAEGTAGERTRIKLKDGTKHTVTDKTGLYVDQAWVGKGSYGRMQSRRARGRVDVLRLPQTSISVLLKEEATRIREHQARELRERKKRVWTPLRDRPLSGQRQYICW